MKGRVYIKNKHFLVNFISIAIILLLIILAFLFGIYWLSVSALEREIKAASENTNRELAYRTEDILEQCNQMATNIVVNERVKLFATHENPEYLVSNFYSELNGILNTHGVSYIDSIILYSPQTGKVFFGGLNSGSYKLSEITNRKDELFDVTWVDLLNEEERTTTELFIRAQADIWPYYITLLKQYRVGTNETVVLINVNLVKLYDYLMAGRGESLQLFLVDDEQRVIARSEKKELYSDIGEYDVLQSYRQGESFSEILGSKKNRTIYAQFYSEGSGITCVTIHQVNDYLSKIERMRRLFMGGVTLAVFVAICLAVIYSVRLERPMQDIREILDHVSNNTTDDIKYKQNISDIADRIISYIQMNSSLRAELDVKLDLLKNSQMVALQSQINPHFLFNTLNRISLMIDSGYSDKKSILTMISNLSDILRYSLTESKTASIREEVQYIKKYLSIMQYRYGEFMVSVDVAENVYQYAIPRLVLQPLVENALQHGISALLAVRECRLSIRIGERMHRYADGTEMNSVCVEIEDNGIGIGEAELENLRNSIADQDNISSEHIGVKNVAQRFGLLFRNHQEMTLESVLGKGTYIRIVFRAMIFEEEDEEKC